MNATWWVRQDQLDEDQLAVVKMSLDDNFLVLGPPGSGKTNLLLMRAKYLTLANHHDLHIITLGRSLQEFMASGSSNYAFQPSRIVTSTRWQQSFLKQYGRHPSIPESMSFADKRSLLIAEIDKLIAERKLEGIYDALLLDEAQDYLPREVAQFSKLAKRLFAVADSGQKIYGGDDPLPALRAATSKEVVLHYHYRLGLKICRFADAIGKAVGAYPLEPTCNYNEKELPSTVDRVECDSVEDQGARIVEKLLVQRRAYPDELLGVLCPRNDDAAAIWQAVSRSNLRPVSVFQSSKEGYERFTAGTRVVVSTIHGAKGLEFRAVHLAAMENLPRMSSERSLAYVGASRAKTALSVYFTGSLPGYMDAAFGALKRVTGLPDVGDVFGGGKDVV